MSMRRLIRIVEDAVGSPHHHASEAFLAWFGDSKVVDATGAPLVVYHGAMRADRISNDNAFLPYKATSGPMSFFTDSPEVASNYAASKPDTSFDDDIQWQTLWTINGSRGLKWAWRSLPQQTRDWIIENGWTIHDADTSSEFVFTTDPDVGENYVSKYQWDEFLRRNGGNGLMALWDIWVNGGALVGSERSFEGVLRAAGIKGSIGFDHPHDTYAGVIPVYLSIQNPLDTSNIPRKVITALANTSKRKYAQPSTERGVDAWEKNAQDPALWITNLKDPSESMWVWTSIPDWVTATLIKLGYDGIKDTGGKGGGAGHVVWIPFRSNQVKSAVGNKGSYDPNNYRLTEGQ